MISNDTIFTQSLEVFFIDGKSDAMLTTEIFNWLSHVSMQPRICAEKTTCPPMWLKVKA
jgi:hypothetical protein